MFTHNRQSIDLNGTWKFCPDPMQRCRRQKWWKNPPRANELFPCWDPEGLWEIRVPGTWKTEFPELKWYDGHAVYMREFEVKDIPRCSEAFLAFDGVLYSCDVYLNGHFVGHHEWGYSPFELRVTGRLEKKNRLFVLVENHLRPDRVPGEVYDWNNDGGIINPVTLVFVPRNHIENFRVATRLEGDNAVVTVDVFLQSRDARASESVTVRVPELGQDAVVRAAAGVPARATFRIPLKNVTLWSPKRPKLYRVELSTRHEALADEVGLREVRTEGRQVLLNGRPIHLYGICTHAEFKDTGRAATPAGIELMIRRIKELGANFVRCAHYPYAEAFGRAMDRAGLMWWEEVPAYWLLNMRDADQTRRACGMMREAVRRDWNRASVIIWSVSNECCYRNPENPNDNNYSYWFKVVPMVRELDPSRLISCAEAGNVVSSRPVWNPGQGDEFRRVTKEAAYWQLGHSDEWYALFDVFSINMYMNRKGEAPVAYRRIAELLRPYNKPLMMSEFGSMSLRGARVPPSVLGSEKRHAMIVREAYEALADIPEFVGYCPWCLVDVRVPIHWRWYNRGKGVFRYGFCDEQWRKKSVFEELRKAIAGLKKRMGE